MPFDQPTRNRLARFVADARRLLTDEFTRQLQNVYGLDPLTGEVSDLSRLSGLDDTQRETATILRETLAHYLGCPVDKLQDAKPKERQAVLDRITREQSFTVLNRLCAMRLAEARGILLPSVSRGYNSNGFQLYTYMAGPALGETGDAYRAYLLSVWDELAVDLPSLFDRFSPQGRLFPREAALLSLLDLVNAPDLEPLWAEDETIGWIYQYFNSKEERQAMRAASGAPRNSRELAVRNQFFTPRYVVEFLTDNTLGRTWYEMTQGRTGLTESCRYLVRRPAEVFLAPGEPAPEQPEDDGDVSQEELLRRPVYIPHRPLKDPRDITMLDPACGSMHFGLYAFDLYERIYEEAWDLEEERGIDALARPDGLPPLHDAYGSKESFLLDVPRLIIGRNIHGIDIDPRAVQIAGLSLWLRAQRSWHDRGVKPAERPAIRRANIVCAEPMPGDKAMLEEFLAGLQGERLEALMRRAWNVPAEQRLRVTPEMSDALCNLVRTVWQEMQLAGEAGSLLKIEETLAGVIERGRAEWEEKQPLFRVLQFGLSEEEPEVSYEQVVEGEGGDFWERAEGLVLAALATYAERTANEDSYRRRLFAGDAERGFAFVDLCRSQFDVTLMNPPFGLPTDVVFAYQSRVYPNTYVDIYGPFVERGIHLSRGFVGAITPRTFIAAKKMTRWREQTLVDQLEFIADFGMGVMDDAMVRSCAYTIRSSDSPFREITALDVRTVDKGTALLDVVSEQTADRRHDVRREFIRRLPGKKILYFVTPSLAALMTNAARLEPGTATVRGGMRTFDDERYLRLRWEVDPAVVGPRMDFDYYAKGGEYANYYTNVHLLVYRKANAAELCETNRQLNGQTAQVRQGSDYYYRRGCQFTTRSKGFSARAIPDGCVMSSNAPMVISTSAISTEYLLGWVNSRLIRAIIEMQSMADDFIPGTLKALPWIAPDRETYGAVSTDVEWLISSYRHLGSTDELDPYFLSPVWHDLFDGIASYHQAFVSLLEASSSVIRERQARITEAVDAVYRLDSTDLGDDVLERDVTREITYSKPTLPEFANRIASYLLGVVFGRFDVRVKAMSPPSQLALFQAIPACPPGMLQNAVGLPASQRDLPVDYPVQVPWSGILVDQEGHPCDVEQRLRKAMQTLWSATAEPVERETCEILRVKSMRAYFRNPDFFFADHLKRYSKSRRQAPIYWPLSTPSNSYTLWLYYHRLTDQTLYTCVNDFVDPKLKQVGAEVERLGGKKGRSTADERELERLNDLLLELKDLRAELLRVAAFWRPNLNDGVQITAAPLWRLFQSKPWQKKLRETWEKLEAGEYDWAHLAYSIWPERVREKCRTDKSLAIAHGLEAVYVEPPAGKARKKRGRPARDIDEGSLLDEV